jgi:hypothetical protein
MKVVFQYDNGAERSEERVKLLTEQTLEKLPVHWQNLFPALQIIISKRKLNEVIGLSSLTTKLETQMGHGTEAGVVRFWKHCQVLIDRNSSPVRIYVCYDEDSPWSNPDYYYMRELLQVLALTLLHEVPLISEAANRNATGMAAESRDLLEIAFRDSFAKFFLNPTFLEERKPDAWNFMKRIETEVRHAAVISG